jgi:hypothetical protein
MRPIRAILFASLVSLAHANEALDILEADKSPVATPTFTSSGAGASGGSRENLVYPDPVWPDWQNRTFDPVWARAVLFQNDSNPYVQQIAISGFFDFQASFGKADIEGVGAALPEEVNLDSTRTRRARLGARIRAFSNTDIEAAAEIAGDSEYHTIERLSARTEFRENWGVSYGKFRPEYTAEFRQEPEHSPYPDRSMLVNMLAPASTLGVRYDYRKSDWEYAVGWFSGDSHPDIPSLQGDGFLTASIAHTLVERSEGPLMRTRWHLDYIHNFDASRSGSIPRYNVAGRSSANGNQAVASNPSFRHLFSTGFTLEQERFSFLGDFMIGKGDTTAWGLTLAPTWWAVPGLVKIVGRYHYAGSDDSGALVTTMGAAADPYFDSTPFFIGDEYHSFYLGANAHLYQDKLVFMTGLENVILNDEAGGNFNTEAWIWHTGLKSSF